MDNRIDIIIDNIEYEFIELIYYSGEKLLINKENKYILAWNNEYFDHETWFFIKLEDKDFQDYLNNEKTLLDSIKDGETQLVRRYYIDYYSLRFKDGEFDINKIDLLPTGRSYLGFKLNERNNEYKF